MMIAFGHDYSLSVCTLRISILCDSLYDTFIYFSKLHFTLEWAL
jgi:hypothetical protein